MQKRSHQKVVENFVKEPALIQKAIKSVTESTGSKSEKEFVREKICIIRLWVGWYNQQNKRRKPDFNGVIKTEQTKVCNAQYP